MAACFQWAWVTKELRNGSPARLEDIPISRAAAEIEPVSRMLSSSLALPGPMRAPDSKTMLTLSRAMSGPSRDLPPGDRQPGRTQRKFVWSSGSASKSAAAPATASGSRRRNLCAGSRVGGAASFRDWLIAEPG